MAKTLRVEIVGDYSSLQKSFRGASRSAQGFQRDLGRSARGAIAASVSFKGLGRSLSFASAQFLGGAGIVYALKQVVSETSRVQEETEKTGVVFGKNAKQVQDWSKTLAQSFGVSEGAALEATGRFGNMLRPLGFGTDAAAKMSERLVELAADMASFNNAKPGEVLQALSSGLAGQVRPLRQYGVFLSQDRIKQEALNDGIAANAAHLTQAQKVQAAYNIILKDTKNAQGDVSRNTGSLSVAMSKLTAGIQDTETGLGQALLPTITKYVNKAAVWLNNTENQKRVQKDFNQALNTAQHIVDGAADSIKKIDRITGSFKHTLELLIGLKFASSIAGWADSLGVFNRQAKTAEERSLLLQGTLKKLAAIGVITIGIEVLLNKDSIDKTVSGFLDKHGLGFLNGGKFNLPKGTTSADVGRMIDQAKASGADSLLIETLQKLQKYLVNEEGVKNATSTREQNPRANVPGSPGYVNPSTGTGKVPVAGLDRLSKIQDRISEAQRRMSQGDKSAKSALVAALRDQIRFDDKYAAIQLDLAKKGGKAAKKHASTYRQLLDDATSAQDQINSLNEKATKADDAANKKKKATLKKQKKIASDAAANAKQALKDALDAARSVIGDIGQGPVATGPSASFLQQYGGHLDAKAYTQDLASQNKQGTSFLKNLNVLGKRGAPPALIQTLLSQGQGGMDEAAALAAANKAQLAGFLKNYKQRQKLLAHVAQMEVHTPTVTVKAKNADIRSDAHDRPTSNKFGRTANSGKRR